MTQIKAMKQALEALEATGKAEATIYKLRAAIEQAEKAEPVAFYYKYLNCFNDEVWTTDHCWDSKTPLDSVPLYTNPAPVPAGWQLVPVEPTKAMLSAGWGNDHLYADLYKAMLAAAPKPGEMK